MAFHSRSGNLQVKILASVRRAVVTVTLVVFLLGDVAAEVHLHLKSIASFVAAVRRG